MYSNKIQQVRREAQEVNAANKIIDMLDKLRLSSNENSPRRWIWELLQNAKDVTNSSGKVKIMICFNEEKGILKFSHNGKPFTTTQLVYLIEQVSTKERSVDNSKEEKKSGKFGTGFLTTHLLSEQVVVTGILGDKETQLRSFNVHIDRSGKNKDEIVKAIQSSYAELENSIPLPSHKVFDENCYTTRFQYVLNNEGIEVAKAGMEDLNVSIPYVLSLIPEIEEIKIEPKGIVYKSNGQINCDLENSEVFRISRLYKEKEEDVFVLLLTEDDVTIAIALEQSENTMKIKQYDSNQPKLFCDFPLVGTCDFPFPTIVNSSRFNPTEPRDGVFLINNNNEKVEENKIVMQKACYLYKKFLSYSSQKGWHGIYNITCVKQYHTKDWFSKDWINEHIVNVCKDNIKYCPIVDTPTGKRIALYDDIIDYEQVFIINSANEEGRNNIWDLASKLYMDAIPCKEDIHNWYFSLWNECHNFSLESLTRKLEEIGNIKTLSSKLQCGRVEDWLSEYYVLLMTNKMLWSDIKEGFYAVFPNQNGMFCKATELYIDDDIDEEYKDILQLLGEDCRKKLMYKDIKTDMLIACQIYDNEDIINEIDKLLQLSDKETTTVVYSRLLILYDNNHKNCSKQIDIIRFINCIWELSSNRKCVKYISEKMLEQSIKYMTTRIADTIGEQQEMTELEKIVNLYEEHIITWLDNFIKYVKRSGYENLLNRKTYPILPNQNGKFISKDDLFLDDEVDEILKDLSLSAGYDIRNELLLKQVYLELPSNREKHSEDLAPYITKYVKENHRQDISQNESVRNFLKILFIWINENLEKAKKIFPEILENKHWLYDDKEIATNMKKAEVYDNLLEKYEISSPDILEQILKQTHNKNFLEYEKEELTEDLLIQSGICSEVELKNALGNAKFADYFIHKSDHTNLKFDYITQILERSKNNILKYLKTQKGYDLNSIVELDKTIFLIKKNNEYIFILVRPSDYEQVILYYDSEKDILDYEKDWELWVENGIDQPQKITFGKMLKLTGINKIPLRKVR